MSSNKKDNNGWILCPSKSFPGKFYYFNVINGEAAWSLNDADEKSLRKDHVMQNAVKSHSYPEPSSPPAESPTTNIGPIHRTVPNITRQTLPNIPPMFGQATFPTCFSNVDPYMQNIIWTPIQLPMFAKPRQDQIMQTWEPEREALVPGCSIPLSKRFINYEEPNTNYLNQIASCTQNKHGQSTNTINYFDSQINKPMTTSQIFGQKPIFRQNKIDASISKMTNNFFNDESNKTMTNTQLFDSKATFENNPFKKIIRQRTQSESDKNIEKMYDNQNYGVTSAQMLEKDKNSIKTKDQLISIVRRQRTQSDSDSIIFEKPHYYDNSKSTLTTSNTGHNAIQQNAVSSKTEDQTKNSFVLRKSILDPHNKVQCTKSQMKITSQAEKAVRMDCLWYKQDRNSLEENKKCSQDKNDKKMKEKENSLDKLDKDDLRYTLENKRRKSIDMGILGHEEGNKVKTHNLNTKQKETPKKRVTFDLDSEISVEELQDGNENQIQYVTIHTLRSLTKFIAEYWYIVVDTNVLLDDFEFMDKFVQLDSECRLLIPYAVQSEIESFCFGDCRGQQRVIVARQVIRKLATPPPHVIVQPIENEDSAFANMSTLGRILNCCLQMIEQSDHVVLITDESILYEKAKSLKIHCFKLKEIKDGASKPAVPYLESMKITSKNDSNKNLFLQKDIDTTWKLSGNEKKITKENILKNSYVQTDIPPTIDANTSPIIFEETIDKNNGKSSDYLNFDYDNNSDSTDMSKTMKNLFIRDNNSNFVIKKAMTNNTSKLDDSREHNSFTFQINNKNTLQKQNATSNNSEKVKGQKPNQLQNAKEKSNTTQKSMKESIFSISNDSLKNIKFQIQNKPKKEVQIENKNVEFRIQTNEKEIHSIPNSNNTNRRLIKEKIRNSIQEKLKNRFQVSSNLMKENIMSNIDEWICTFVQILENALSGLLQESNLSSLSLPPPWTLHEAVTCIKQVYNELWAVCVVADELSLLLVNNSTKQGKLKRTMKPEEFMRVFGCGVLLIEQLQATGQMPECIQEAQQLLNEMSLTLLKGKEDIDLERTPVLTSSDNDEEDKPKRLNFTLEGKEDIDLERTPMLTRSDDDEEDKPKRLNFIKKSSEVLQYLKKYFPEWQSHEESPAKPTPTPDEVVTNNNQTKIVRTCGRNLNLLTIDKTNSMTMNAIEKHTIDKQKEKSLACIDNNEDSERNITPNTLLSSENTVKVYERREEPRVVRLLDVTTPFLKKNQEESPNIIKQNENTENVSQNTTQSTVKLYEEPKIVRIFDASTPFPPKKTSKDTNNALILLSPKHGNTFGSQEDKAGPKVVRNIKLIDAFEEKLKFKVDMDELDYSAMEETLSTVSNSSQSTVIDGNDSNNDKISLNDQNNDTDAQNKDRSNVSPYNKNSFINQKNYTDIQNYDESNISTNDSFNDDRNNENVQNNDLSKPNDSSTNDSGFVNENDTYTLVQTFLSELSGSMKLIYKFIEDSMKEFRNKDLESERRKKILDKATTTHGHLAGIIYKLECIVQREADPVTPLKEAILKADVVVVSDKRMMRYRQVVIKCLEQAQMLDGALRQLIAIADGDYDVTFCPDRSVYFNIFE